MDDSLKYLIHARITADGVVERTDVVGAIFGQTEGLLGDELEIRGLQESAKLGRIDVEIESENGRSFGRVTIGSNLDKVETAILAAALETIDRVGPCVASIEVTRIEDVRAAKRRAVVERAKELLASGFDEALLSSAEIVDEVRESVRGGPVGEFAELPAGPAVEDSDGIIVVEGRADVRRLLEFGIKNAIAVEGTNVPNAVADLTRGRTATAFLDGDRGGDLILRELAQVGALDYVARAPPGDSVEDLSHDAVTTALQEKIPVDRALERLERLDSEDDQEIDAASFASIETLDGEAAREPDPDTPSDHRSESSAGTRAARAASQTQSETRGADTQTDQELVQNSADLDGEAGTSTAMPSESAADQGPEDPKEAGGSAQEEAPATLQDHARRVIGEGTGLARFLDADLDTVVEGPTAELSNLLAEAEGRSAVALIDDTVGQPVIDEAQQRGLERLVVREKGEMVKQPADVRVHSWAEVSASELPPDS
jgi:DNA primase